MKTIYKYLEAAESNSRIGAALVTMPPGTGKSGIIAVTCRLIEDGMSILVLTPRVALRTQLAKDIEHRFFTHLRKVPPKLVRQVREDPTSEELVSLLNANSAVIVLTVQRFGSIKSNEPELYQLLKQKVSLVIFDEGHFEPAYTWSHSVRQLQLPTILFTATPFRNDFKRFNIQDEHIYCYTYSEAAETSIIRKVRHETVPPFDDPRKFAKELVAFIERKHPGGPSDKCRCIVRCDNHGSILQIVNHLTNAGYKSIGIHEKFSDATKANLFHSVPNPETESAVFWVHQYKLLEGIDDQRFRFLSFYGDHLNNSRSVVQQIGRIIRNPTHSSTVFAWVLDTSNGIVKNRWLNYEEYDNRVRQELARGGDQKRIVWDPSTIVESLSSTNIPPYIDGDWRQPFDLAAIDPAIDVRYPLITNLYSKGDGFKIREFVDGICDEFATDDKVFIQPFFGRSRAGSQYATLVYLTVKNSRYLNSMYFPEAALCVLIVCELDNVVAIFDSTGYAPDSDASLGIGRPIDSSRLKKLFKSDKDSWVTQISLTNSNLGRTSIRSRSFSAASVAETVPSIDDYAQICTTVTGYTISNATNSVARRYIGFQKGRVSESTSSYVDLESYVDWIEELCLDVSRRRSPNDVFLRYSPDVGEPSDPTPRNVLIDFSVVEDLFRYVGTARASRSSSLLIPNKCCDVSAPESSFGLVANGENCTAYLRYIPEKKEYQIESLDLDSIYRAKDQSLRPQAITKYLNKCRAFSVIPQSNDVINVSGQYYRPSLRFGNKFNERTFPIGKVMSTDNQLEKVSSEKGTVCRARAWEKNCLFDFIDNVGNLNGLDHGMSLDSATTILICTDMQTEPADFVLSDKNNVMIIHAKASNEMRSYSASSIHEICSQASKNMHYLSKFSEYEPKNLKSWENSDWSASKVRGNIKRIRRGRGNVRELWSKVVERVRDPNVNCEVWLVLGRILSKGALVRELKKDPPTAEAMQAAMLLHSTMMSAASFGAKIRVFCCP